MIQCATLDKSMIKTILKHAGVIGLYLVLALILTWPVVGNINSHVVGTGGDPWQSLWRLEEKASLVNQALRERSATAIRAEFIGLGKAELVNLSVWPWLPVAALFGVVAGYNVIYLASYVLAGYGMYLLMGWLINTYGENVGVDMADITPGAKRLVREAPGFLAGMAYMLLPYHVAHGSGHFGAMQLQWLPFIVLTAWSLVNKPTIGKGLIVAGLITIQAWTEHHYLLWLIIFCAWFVVYFRANLKAVVAMERGTWSLGLAFVLVLITVGLSLGPTIQLAGIDDSQLDLGPEQVIRYSADPFAYVVPAAFHSLWGSAASQVWGRYFTGNAQETTLFMGYVPILMVTFFWQKIPRRQLKFWLGSALIFFIISLGPKLHLLGYVTGVPLPWAMVDSWPVLRAIRTIARAGVMVNFSWMVLFGWVLATQVKRLGSAGAIAGLIILEFLFLPVPMMAAQTPRAYAVIKDQPGTAVIELPAATNYTIASRALFGSLVHGKTVLNNIALERAQGAQAYREIQSMPALRQILYLRTNHLLEHRTEFLEQDMVETMGDVVDALDIGQVVVHPDSLSDRQLEATIDFMEKTCKLRREEIDDVWLYDSSQLPAGDGVFIARDDAWGEVGREPETGKIIAGIKDEATLTIYNNNQGPKRIVINWELNRAVKNQLTIEGTQVEIKWDEERQTQTIETVALPGKSRLIIRNSAEESVILKQPVMQVFNEL